MNRAEQSANTQCGVLYYQPVWVCRGSGQHQTDSLVYSQSSRGWTGRYQLLYLVISKDCDQVSGRLLPCIGRRVAEQFGRALGPSTSGIVRGQHWSWCEICQNNYFPIELILSNSLYVLCMLETKLWWLIGIGKGWRPVTGRTCFMLLAPGWGPGLCVYLSTILSHV